MIQQQSQRPRRCPSCGQMVGTGTQKPLPETDRKILPTPDPVGVGRPHPTPVRPSPERPAPPATMQPIDPSILSERKQKAGDFYQGPSAKSQERGERWGINDAGMRKKKIAEELRRRRTGRKLV